MAEAVGRLYDSPPTIRCWPRFRSSPRRAVRSAIWPCRSPSSSRAGCARRRAPSRRRSPARSAPIDGILADRGRAERLPQLLPRPPGVAADAGCAEAPRPRRPAGQGDRRAHRHQPEQGGAHRPPAERRARRRVRPPAAVPRPPGRDPELHRRHRRAGRRRRRRLPRARAQDARRGPRDRRRRPVRLLLLGSLRARHRVVRGRQGAAEDPGRRRCTTSSTAATTPPRSPHFIADRIVRAT